VLLAVGIVAAVAGACPRTPVVGAEPVGPVRLRFGITAEPSTLVPLFGGSAADSEVGGLLFRELVAVEAGAPPIGDLAEVVPTLDNHGAAIDSTGRLVVSWTLRSDGRWSDGTPVTSADVVAGWKVALDETQAVTTGRDQAKDIESIDVVDAQHFRVIWRTPQAGFAAPRVHRVLPAHLVLDSNGTPRNLAATGFLRHPVGNGPFVVVDDVPGAHLLLRRRSEVPLSIDEVLVRFMPSTESLASALLAGDLDATFPQAGLSPTEAARLVAEHPGRFTMTRAPGTTWVHLDFNLDSPVLADVRVRRAIAMAIDREAIVHAVAGDAYDVDEGFLPRHHTARLTLPRVVVDAAAAEKLLDEAGFRRHHPGEMRVDGKGAPLQLQLASASGQRDTERLLALVQDSLRTVGVDVVLDLRPFKVFFAEGAKKRRLPHLSFYAWTVDADTTGGSLWRADRIPSADNGFAGLNLPGWRNDDVTRLLQEADATIDDAVRVRNLGKVQALFMSELPALSFYFRPSVVVSRIGVTGLAPSGTQTPLAHGAGRWRAPKPAPPATP
jgi:peptide/nickel transport system substrate-binding protein